MAHEDVSLVFGMVFFLYNLVPYGKLVDVLISSSSPYRTG